MSPNALFTCIYNRAHKKMILTMKEKMTIMDNTKKLDEEELKKVGGGASGDTGGYKCPECGEERNEYFIMTFIGESGSVFKCMSCKHFFNVDKNGKISKNR